MPDLGRHGCHQFRPWRIPDGCDVRKLLAGISCERGPTCVNRRFRDFRLHTWGSDLQADHTVHRRKTGTGSFACDIWSCGVSEEPVHEPVFTQFSHSFRYMARRQDSPLGRSDIAVPQLTAGMLALVVVALFIYWSTPPNLVGLFRPQRWTGMRPNWWDQYGAYLCFGLRNRRSVRRNCRRYHARLPGCAPEVGTMFGLIAFVCVAMGGFGSIPGAFLSGLLVGVVESLAGFYIAPVFKYIAVFGLYLAVVFLRPRGIFGW